jgi:hypothetical protein
MQTTSPVELREEPWNTNALASAEGDEGKTMITGAPQFDGADSASPYTRGLPPTFPPGYTTQVAWGFRDAGEGFFYDFFRVYGPPQPLHGLGPICLLDEGLCYWLTIFWPSDRVAKERPACRWLSFAQARKLAGSRLTFNRFSSPRAMRDEVRSLFKVEGIAVDTRPAETFRFLRSLASTPG